MTRSRVTQYANNRTTVRWKQRIAMIEAFLIASFIVTIIVQFIDHRHNPISSAIALFALIVTEGLLRFVTRPKRAL